MVWNFFYDEYGSFIQKQYKASFKEQNKRFLVKWIQKYLFINLFQKLMIYDVNSALLFYPRSI